MHSSNRNNLERVFKFTPKKMIKIKPGNQPRPPSPSWINCIVKNQLVKSNRAYKKYIRNGCREDDKQRATAMKDIAKKLIENFKSNYLTSLGSDFASTTIGIKKYWSITNNSFNKNRFPVILPLHMSDVIVTNRNIKVQLFNEHIVRQCSIIETGRELA